MDSELRAGDSSARVAEARVTLARLGFLSGDNSTEVAEMKQQKFTDADKYFDEELAELLKAFQQSRGIVPHGAIDELTLRELRQASYTLGARVLQYQPHNELIGDDVVQLQTNLQELGFYAHRVDGRFGPHTQESLMAYQLNAGLQDDGVCGPDTIRSLSLLGRRIRGGSPLAIRERENVRDAGPSLAGKRVVIDPALGGKNKGQIVQGMYGPISEEELLWDLATRVEGRMIATGMETILSRPRNDDPSSQDRAEMANAFDADLMISLHADKYHNELANGAATFYFGSSIGSTSLTGEVLAGFVQREIVARTDLGHCGSHARTWEILRLTNMPTIEVVLGYLTNPHDVSILTDPEARDRIAEAIVVSVKRLYLLDEDHHSTGTFNFSDLLKAEGM